MGVLLLLTGVAGLVDAVSFLRLGHIFVANMTGNIVFLGFAFTGSADLSVSASLVALLAFGVGAAGGGRIGSHYAKRSAALLAIAMLVEVGLLLTALAFSTAGSAGTESATRYAVIIALASAMGLQTAVVRKLAIPDLTTTVLTMTLTDLATESTPVDERAARTSRRFGAIGAMLVGALIGAALVRTSGTTAALLAGAVVLAGCAAFVLRIPPAAGRRAAADERRLRS